MRCVVFNLREEEAPYVEKWKQSHPGVVVDTYEEPLTAKNKELLKGYEGLVVMQFLAMEDEVYDYMGACKLKVLSTRTAGFDMYNATLLKKHGIRLTNVPSYSPNAIGEYALAAALQLTRHAREIETFVMKRDFRWQKPILSKELRCSRVGILGTGRIGQAAARLFKGVGAQVVGFDPYPNDAAKEWLTYVSMDELLSTSDVISLHMPATKDSHHLINAKTIAQMKDGVYLVNTARGAVIDSQALLDSLDKGKIAGAALDAYEFEGPYIPKDNGNNPITDTVYARLVAHERIIYTPHIAFYTETAIENMVFNSLDACTTVLRGEPCAAEIKL